MPLKKFCGVLLCLLAFGLTGCTYKYAGLDAARAGDPMLAASKLEEAVKNNPRDAEVHRALGLAYLDLGDAALAESHLDQAAKLQPSDRMSRRYLAITREKLGWQAKAMDTYAKLIDAFPDDRLTDTFKVHLARLNKALSKLTREAARERYAGFTTQGLADDEGLPRSILVLPFDIEEVNREHVRLGKTLARMLAADLSRLDLVWVIGPDETAAGMRHRNLSLDSEELAGSLGDIGRAYGAGLLIYARFLKGFEDQVRLDIQLYRPLGGGRVMETKIEGRAGEIAVLERDVLRALLGTTGILPNELERSRFGTFVTANPEALGYYLTGMGKLLENNFSAALGDFERSVELDAEYPCPHRALAVIYGMRGERERSRNAANKGRGRGNPRCAADTQLLDFRIKYDNRVAQILLAEIKQGRTALRNGTQTLVTEEGEILSQRLREGIAGAKTTTAGAIPAGWVWGSEGLGQAGHADSSVLGGVKGYGLSSPDPATAGSGSP